MPTTKHSKNYKDALLLRDAFLTSTFSWYEKHKRILPFRNTTNPYKIMISEFMLQQTQVSRVLPKYDAFLKTFPTIKDLANAKLSTVLTYWTGLGYNRRAKFLFESAKIISSSKNGLFPETKEELLTLPGFGEYTASAVCAFAYNQDVVVIDANILLVCNNVFGLTKEEIPFFIKEILPKGKARDFYNALMDIGARYFQKGKIFDSEYPFKDFCKSYNNKEVPSLKKQKQSSFLGSNRFYRGQLLKMLIDKKTLLKKEIAAFQEAVQYNKAISELKKEGFVVEDDSAIYLS